MSRLIIVVGSADYSLCMTGDLSWLPDRHLPVAATLAHADELIETIGDLVLEYLRVSGGPIELTEVIDGRVSHTTIAGVSQVPRAVALYTADALTTLRAAIEHTLYTEVEHALKGRQMTGSESRSIEVPANISAEDFEKWVRDRKKRTPPPMHLGSPLLERVRELQPYHLRKRPNDHPLKVLAEHSNLAKHRMPAVAAARVAAVRPDSPGGDIHITPATQTPARPGDVLATSPMGVRTPVSLFPTVSLRRPHTGEWPILIHELAWLAEWTRTVAIPILVTGSTNVDDIPPRYDTHRSHEDERGAIAAGAELTALQVLDRRRDVAIVRMDLPEILALHSDKPSPDLLAAWVASLDDDAVMERMERLKPGTSSEARLRTWEVAGELVAEMRRHHETTGN